MRTFRKGQAATFNLTHDIRGEARLVERAFSLGPCALTEAVQLLTETPVPREPGDDLAAQKT